jgi:SNF family Na+-dependent transporter
LEARSDTFEKGATMLDVILLALGLAFFALSIGYAYACDRL